ncbi:MAG: hypothetical protein AB1469_05810 [Pseudomonadota bacterium]
MQREQEDALRERIAALLRAGLKTKTEPFPENDREFAALLAELQHMADDLEGKLVLTGFVDHPYGADQMRCQECMYYLVHRKWCDLPELALPVEAHWWCRLWRI